jgi:hypothetical protein
VLTHIDKGIIVTHQDTKTSGGKRDNPGTTVYNPQPPPSQPEPKRGK